MSNQCIVEVRHFPEEVIVLASDNYGKSYLTFDLDEFEDNYGNDIVALLRRVSEIDEMYGTFIVDEDDRVLLDACSSLEITGLSDEPIIYLRSEQAVQLW